MRDRFVSRRVLHLPTPLLALSTIHYPRAVRAVGSLRRFWRHTSRKEKLEVLGRTVLPAGCVAWGGQWATRLALSWLKTRFLGMGPVQACAKVVSWGWGFLGMVQMYTVGPKCGWASVALILFFIGYTGGLE